MVVGGTVSVFATERDLAVHNQVNIEARNIIESHGAEFVDISYKNIYIPQELHFDTMEEFEAFFSQHMRAVARQNMNTEALSLDLLYLIEPMNIINGTRYVSVSRLRFFGVMPAWENIRVRITVSGGHITAARVTNSYFTGANIGVSRTHLDGTATLQNGNANVAAHGTITFGVAIDGFPIGMTIRETWSNVVRPNS